MKIIASKFFLLICFTVLVTAFSCGPFLGKATAPLDPISRSCTIPICRHEVDALIWTVQVSHVISDLECVITRGLSGLNWKSYED